MFNTCLINRRRNPPKKAGGEILQKQEGKSS
jgi:hypothetical protein